MSSKPKKIWIEWSFLGGLVVTLVTIFLFGYSFTLSVEADSGELFATKWKYLVQAPPNELGDTLAGLAGSLAFVGVVVAVLLQATELKEQREEFAKMATALEAQTLIIQDEQRQRSEIRAEKLLNEKIETLSKFTLSEKVSEIQWTALETSSLVTSQHQTPVYNFLPLRREKETFDDWFSTLANHWELLPTDIWLISYQGLLKSSYHLPPPPEIFKMIKKMNEILEMRTELGKPELERLERLDIESAKASLEKISQNSEFWDIPADEIDISEGYDWEGAL